MKIEQKYWDMAKYEPLTYLEVANKAIELQIEAQEQAQPVSWNTKYTDSTPKLSVGNSAFEDWFQAQPFATQTGIKQMCRDSYAAGMGDPLVTYAATQAQPEAADPHATLRVEYAEQMAEGTVGFYLWEYRFSSNQAWGPLDHEEFFPDHRYRCTDISCYVSKDGEPAIRMLRTEAQALKRQTKDTHDWFAPAGTGPYQAMFEFTHKGTYTYRTKKPKLKQLDWSRVPVGTMTNAGVILSSTETYCTTFDAQYSSRTTHSYLRLAPASEQPWLYWGGGECPVPEGCTFEVTLRIGVKSTCAINWTHRYDMGPIDNQIIAYRVTGLAGGYTDRSDV